MLRPDGLQHRTAAPTRPCGWVIPLRFSACPPLFRCSARAREQERACSPFDLGGPAVSAEPGIEGAMTEDFGMEATVSLDTMIERHIAALSATSEAVHEWDERRAAGDVTNVVYAKALLEARGDERGRGRQAKDREPLAVQRSARMAKVDLLGRVFVRDARLAQAGRNGCRLEYDRACGMGLCLGLAMCWVERQRQKNKAALVGGFFLN